MWIESSLMIKVDKFCVENFICVLYIFIMQNKCVVFLLRGYYCLTCESFGVISTILDFGQDFNLISCFTCWSQDIFVDIEFIFNETISIFVNQIMVESKIGFNLEFDKI